MSNREHFGEMEKDEHSPSRRRGNSANAHSYWIGSRKGIGRRYIPYREKVVYDRVLRFTVRACRADYAVLIVGAHAYPHDESSRTYIYPEPVSDEEAKLWEYMAAYIGESVRLGVPLNIPESLRDALNLGTVLVSPVFDYAKGGSVIAVFTGSSSRPFDSEDEKILSRLTGKFTDVLHAAISPENTQLRSRKVSRVLRARNILLSVSELCGTLDGLLELAVSLKLAESAYVRILDGDTNMLKLVALAGNHEGLDMRSHVPASKCSVMCLPSKTRIPRYVDPHQCYSSLSRSENVPAICVPFSDDSGNIAVLSLWNPPDENLDTADMRLIRAIASVAERAFMDTHMFSAGLGTWTKTALAEYVSIASRASEDVTHISRELLTGLRKTVNFQVGAFVNYHNGFQVFSVLFSSTDPLIAHSGEFESQDITGDFYFSGASGDTSASIVLGDPEAEEWANKALKQLEPDITHMFIRPFYMHDSSWPSCLAVPLVSGGDTIGCFIMGKPRGDRFYEEDIDFCESVRHELMLVWEKFMARIKPRISPAVEAMLERIETLEQLAVGTAHEIKNPLSVIKGYMQIMQLDQGLSPEIRQRIERLLRQVEQISRIADDLAGLVKLTTAEMSLIHLPNLMEEVLATMESQVADTNISIVCVYQDDVPEIPGDAGKLQQAFLNICRNAVEAMGVSGGELRVEVRISKDGRNAEIEFRDSGPGISREAMMMMFRPFFTTKRHGTGLGLNISMHIIRLHDGTIRAENVRGGTGAMFTVVLPTESDGKSFSN